MTTNLLLGCGVASDAEASNRPQANQSVEYRELVISENPKRTIKIPKYGPVIGSLAFVEPKPGAKVTAGSTLRVTVNPSRGFKPHHIMIACKYDTAVVETAPYTVELHIPKTAIGQLELSALAFDDKWNTATSDLMRLPIEVRAKRLKLSARNTIASPDGSIIMPMFSFVPRQQIVVDADYADGVKRCLDDSGVRLSYRVDNPAIATVDKQGMLTAHAAGKSTLIVSDGEISLTIVVVVDDADGLWKSTAE